MVRKALLLILLAVAAPSAAQPVSYPVRVDGWEISRQQLGCTLEYRGRWEQNVDDPTFSGRQRGKEEWKFHWGEAISNMSLTHMDPALPRPMVRWVEIDGRRFEISVLERDDRLSRLAGAGKVTLFAQGYRDVRTAQQRAEAAVAEIKAHREGRRLARSFRESDFRWETASQVIRAPSSAAAQAFRTCNGPRAGNRPATLTYNPQQAGRAPGPFSSSGSFADLIGDRRTPAHLCAQEAFSGSAPTMTFTVSVVADGTIGDVRPSGGSENLPGAKLVRAKVQRGLSAEPATDANGWFTSSITEYRSVPMEFNCTGRQ